MWCSLATLIRKRKTGEHAVDAWRRNYGQLEILFTEVPGFEEFMVTIASNTLRDSMYGTIYRVGIGALLSMTDVATDIYVITTYYATDALVGQAHALLAMITANLVIQIVTIFVITYPKKSLLVKLRETLISMLFLRPAVDAYRVSTNHKDEDTSVDPMV